ncbi:hypothetical protein QUC31_011596 [Theobroma cacao]
MAGGGTTLEFTPTWVVAVVCAVIVVISLAAERILHYTGKYLKKKHQKPLFEALEKIKEELMLLGFISLLLTVFQDCIGKICIAEHSDSKWLPCKKYDTESKSTSHFQALFLSTRHLLAEASDSDSDPSAAYCAAKGKVPLLSTTALHHLHIFIFVLAVVHVTFCALTILFGSAKLLLLTLCVSPNTKSIRAVLNTTFTHVQDHDFIKNRFLGIGKNLALLSWMHSFFKQFFGSVTKSDYVTLRLGFINTHCRGNPKFNFHKYMMRALEADFKKVVGISWYLWLFVVAFLLLNIHGWHAYFWIAFIPFMLLLAVGTQLEHVITQLAHEVAEKHVAIEGDLVVQPSDDHFWFHRPQIVLLLIHIILFQNSFELACFFWILVQYHFDSCIMGEVGYVIPRLVIGVIVQFLCSYSTLPLYAIVTQMGSSFKKAIFEEHVQEGIAIWARRAKSKAKGCGKTAKDPKQDSLTLELAKAKEEEKAVEIASESITA